MLERHRKLAQRFLELQANIALEKWDAGIEACNKAIQIKPDFDLAKNNLAAATRMKGK